MKRIFFAIGAILLLTVNIYAVDINQLNDTYKEQLKESGAYEIKRSLPKETESSLENIGIDSLDWREFSNITPEKIFAEVLAITKERAPTPLRAITTVIAIMLLCALVDSLKLSFGDRPLGGIIGAISTLCISACIITPIVECISRTAGVIKSASVFMLCYIPVITGIMIAGGQAVTAASYHTMMIGVGEIISQISTGFLVPMLNIFLALSVVSSISPRLNTSSLCDMFSKTIKWILSFVMSVFVSLLAMQNIVTTAADNTGSRAIRFAISSFVPIVGGALSDAFNTVQGCVKLLKSGVGAFGIIASGFIFIPIIVECLIWLITVNLCSSIGDIFELRQISSLLRASAKVISTMISIVLCCVTILIISTVFVLVIGGGS